MQRKVGLILLAAFASLALFSCSTQNVGQTNLPDKDASAFKLNVSDDSYLFGASAGGYNLQVEEQGQDVLVKVNVENAQHLTALYFDMNYDASQYRPLTSGPTDAMAPQSEILQMTYMKDQGVLRHGQVVTHADLRTGFTGSGTVAMVAFRKMPANFNRTVSTPPKSDQSNPVLSINGAGDTLSWGFYNQGDYDQNGRVAVQDLTPIGLNFQDAATDGPDGPKKVVDGNNDGVISVQDLTPIGVNFGRRLESYNVYSSTTNSDKNATNNDPSTIAAAQNIPVSAAVANPTPGGRKSFTATVAIDPTALYWVRAADETGAEGSTSNTVSSNPANQPSVILDPTTPASSGDGSSGSPFQVGAGTFHIVVFDVGGGGGTDVSVDAATAVAFGSDSTTGTAPTLTVGATTVDLTVAADTSGDFTITATYQGNNAAESPLFFHAGGGGGGSLFIQPATGDANWAGVPNKNDASAGTTSDLAFVMHDSTFNTTDEGDGTFSLVFGMEASADAGFGTLLDGTTLTWGALPPFTVTYQGAPTDGSFKVNTFSNGYISATDAVPQESNKIYVYSQINL